MSIMHAPPARLCTKRLTLPLALAACSAAMSAARAAQTAAPPPPAFANTAANVAYVGSKACAECHADIYASFSKTDMGRAMLLPAEVPELDNLRDPVRVKHPKADVYYEVYRRGPDLYQAEYALDAQGTQTFRDEQKVSYILGSGANGFSCIVRRGDFLFEAPLSYYSQTRTWDLSPGYERGDYSFNRPVQAGCIVCHSGRPQPVEGSKGRFEDPPFRELSIGCENCHGPGALHVAERRRGAPLEGSYDRSIVNPETLPPWLATNICMDCHQGADARALMPRKRYVDFRPGTPLADTLAIFAVPFNRAAPPADPLLEHFTLMSLSQCYLKSGGKLACTSCHDPHQEPTPAEAPAFFRARCLTCHTEKSCGVPLAVRAAKHPPDDCAGCHMPKQPLHEVSHSSLTDHRILARPGEPFPEAAFHLTTPARPDLVLLNADPTAPAAPLPLRTLFSAYGELMAQYPQYQPRFDAVLDELARAKQPDAAVLSALGRRKLRDDPAGAAVDFERAIQAGSSDDFDYEQLSTFQAQTGKTAEAIWTIQSGLKVNPYAPQLYRLLAALYVSVKSYPQALSTAKEGVAKFPEDGFLRSLIPNIEAALGR